MYGSMSHRPVQAILPTHDEQLLTNDAEARRIGAPVKSETDS